MKLFTFPSDQTITLTINADTVPGLIGSAGTTDTRGDADVYIATNTTLTAADRIHDEAGDRDSMVYGQSGTLAAPVNIGAFEMSGVETLRATNDSNQIVDFDLSGTRDLERVAAVNSRQLIIFDELTTLADVEVEDATAAAPVIVQYQNSLLAGTDDTVNLFLEANNRLNSAVGVIQLGSVATGNGGIENLNINVEGNNTAVVGIDSNVTNVTITGEDGSALVVGNYFNNTLRSLDAQEYAGDLQLGVGQNTGEGTDLAALLGSGNDTLWVAGGRLDANLGAGDDRIIFDTGNATANHGFRSDDAIDGGEGIDVLQLGVGDNVGNFVLATTEFNNKQSLEVIDVRAAVVNMTLSQGFVDSADQTLLITSDNVGGNNEYLMVTTVDTTQLAQNTALNYVGGDGSDRLVLNDATFNSAVNLDGGGNYNDGPPASNAGLGDYDTLTVVGGTSATVIDAADLGNIRNFEGMNLVKQGGGTTTINLVLTQAFLNQNTLTVVDARTTIDDRIFQIFSAASQNGVALGAGDTVNVEMSAAVFNQIAALGRGFDYTSLLASGATVNFTIDGAAADAVQLAALIGFADTAAARGDVIGSRANPLAVAPLDTTLGVDGIDGAVLGRDIETSQATLQAFDVILGGGFDLNFNGAATPNINTAFGQQFAGVTNINAINLDDAANTVNIVDAGAFGGGNGIINGGNVTND